MKCSGPCKQGRVPCQTPMSCELPELESPTFMFYRAAATVVYVIACVALIMYFLGNLPHL